MIILTTTHPIASVPPDFSKALARKHNYEVDASQELAGLGIANIAGAAFSAYPATGSGVGTPNIFVFRGSAARI